MCFTTLCEISAWFGGICLGGKVKLVPLYVFPEVGTAGVNRALRSELRIYPAITLPRAGL